MLRSDERREEFKGADQRQRGPGADQGTYRAVAEAVRQVGTDGGDDASAKARAWQGVPSSITRQRGRADCHVPHNGT